MKVLLINGSAKLNGCTYTALSEVERSLNEEGIETEIYNIGNKPVSDCLGCKKCQETNKCIMDDIVNEVIEKAKECDGFIFGSPVYYAHPSARLLAVLDRAFYAGSKYFAFKPGASVVSARRAGTSASMDAINKHFTINQMPVVSSTYWNNIHGNTAEEAKQDLEGMQTMYNLGKNMAWLIKCIDLGKNHQVLAPQNTKIATNFIR